MLYSHNQTTLKASFSADTISIITQSEPGERKGDLIYTIEGNSLVISTIANYVGNRDLRGIGCMLIYEAGLIARRRNLQAVKANLVARDATDFYKKLGFTPSAKSLQDILEAHLPVEIAVELWRKINSYEITVETMITHAQTKISTYGWRIREEESCVIS